MSKAIAIEGIDGAGKATQAKRLAEAIHGRLFSFPDYASDSGKILREHLTGDWAHIDPRVDMFIRQSLMTINRYEAMDEIKRTVESGQHIVFDRWWLSSLAYGIAEGVDRDWILQVSRSLLQPDLWIYIDVPGAVGGGRRLARDNNERDLPKLERVRLVYLSEMLHCPNAVTIDGTAGVDDVTGLIKEAVGKNLGHQTFWKWS